MKSHTHTFYDPSEEVFVAIFVWQLLADETWSVFPGSFASHEPIVHVLCLRVIFSSIDYYDPSPNTSFVRGHPLVDTGERQ